ncbi:MAG TPA: hypothetical protein VD906_10770 [Caulobacteraceae bacterium]|nr:hypothetical protein [Caulobacteraceae bacterium]
MLDLRKRYDCAWDEALRPRGEGELDKEDFTSWWERNGERLAHLAPRIAEQWIYRHWTHSYTAFVSLTDLTWRLESWSGDEVLNRAHMEFGGPFAPDDDYKIFNGARGFGPNATARAMNAGSWDMPLLLLETPSGIQTQDGEMPLVRFLVAEGSKRMRYLHALRARGEGEGPHEVFILKSPAIT